MRNWYFWDDGIMLWTVSESLIRISSIIYCTDNHYSKSRTYFNNDWNSGSPKCSFGNCCGCHGEEESGWCLWDGARAFKGWVSVRDLDIRSAFTVMSMDRSEDFTSKCREVTSYICMVNIHIFGSTNPKTSINHTLFSRVILRCRRQHFADILGWLILRVLSIRVYLLL